MNKHTTRQYNTVVQFYKPRYQIPDKAVHTRAHAHMHISLTIESVSTLLGDHRGRLSALLCK